MPYSHGIRWSRGLVDERVMEIAAIHGRMPSAREVRSHAASWAESLATAIYRHGGSYDETAERLGLDKKRHCSRKGWFWESWVAEELRFQGAAVEPQRRTKAPFDLLVNGHRVDVKCAESGEYGNQKQCRGWFFNLRGKEGACDYYVFACLQDEAPARVYVLPESAVPVTMVTITNCGSYEGYRDRWDLLT